jgi:16S rRNA (cytosine1402-N4)-methyltransferase
MSFKDFKFLPKVGEFDARPAAAGKMNYWHIPVLFKEVLECLNPQSGNNFVDCTFGGGGYSFSMADKILPNGRIIGIDLDEMSIDNGQTTIKTKKIKNIILVHDNFKNLRKIIEENWPDQRVDNIFDGILFDLGLSSAQLQDRNRGFTFKLDAPLNMSFGQVNDNETDTTEKIINKWSENEIIRILKEYGEEEFAGRIARAIVGARKIREIKTTDDLVKIIAGSVPTGYKHKKIHFATKTFQALRIASNDELENLESVLPQAVDLLKPGGKLAVISYHSLEDRIVKNYFKTESRDCICPPACPKCVCGHQAKIRILTKKPIIPTDEEIKMNNRSRSAKMRVAQKI